MKKSIFLAVLAFCLIVPCRAQNSLGVADDYSRLSLIPIISDNTAIPPYAHDLLMNRLRQIVTRNGLGGDSYDQRFVITANFVEMSKEVSSSAPVMYSVNLDATLYIGDIATGTLFSSCSLGEIKGLAKTDNRAYLSAIKRISPDDPRVQRCLEEGKNKIIEYYNSQIDFLIAKAYAFADQEDYWDAIDLLMDVPDVCKDAYMKAMDAIGGIYQRKIDAESAVALAQAEAIWSATLSYDGAIQAAELLSMVHPQSSSAAGAASLNQKIATRIREVDKREWAYKVQAQKNEYNLSKAGIEAARAVGIAQAKRPVYYYNVRWW